MFFGIVANHLVVVREVGRQLALEARSLLGPQFAAALFLCIAGIRLQTIQFVSEAIDDLFLMFCRGRVMLL